jgi:hypothetical protein
VISVRGCVSSQIAPEVTNVGGLDTLAAAEDAESLAHRAVVAGGQHGPTRRKIPLFGKSNNRM